MNFNEYQALAKTTAIYPEQIRGLYPLIGLFGEATETIEKAVGDLTQVDVRSQAGPELARIIEIFKTIIPLGKEAETIKKYLRGNGLANGIYSGFDYDGEEDLQELKKELGDVLWYMAAICSDFGLSLDDVATTNYNKLKDRMNRNVIQGSGDNR